jgi:hypothetical protein
MNLAVSGLVGGLLSPILDSVLGTSHSDAAASTDSDSEPDGGESDDDSSDSSDIKVLANRGDSEDEEEARYVRTHLLATIVSF